MNEKVELASDSLKEIETTESLRLESRESLQELSAEIAAVLPDFDLEDQIAVDALGKIAKNYEKEAAADKAEKVNEKDQKLIIRLRALKAEKLPLRESLSALRQEFKDSIDEETDAVLAQFEALFSPDLIPDEKERAMVESLFFTQGVSDFTPAAFTVFLDVIYEQPDEKISAETKDRIHERFAKPKEELGTAQELRKSVLQKSEDGSFQHDSPDNALQFQNGTSGYVDESGEVVVIVSYRSSVSGPIESTSYREPPMASDFAQYLNYTWTRLTVHNTLDAMTGLFGGKQENEQGWRDEPIEAVKRANRFIRQILGPRSPDHLMQGVEISNLNHALQAMVNPMNQTEEQNYSDLRNLGILNGTEFNWSRLKVVGRILRKNRFFKAQAIRNPSLPHQFLVAEMKRGERNSNTDQGQPEELTSAIGQSGGGLQEGYLVSLSCDRQSL